MEKTLDELEMEAERGLTEWLKKPNPVTVHRNKLWFPLSDYKDVGSFMAYNRGQKKTRKNGRGPLDFRVKKGLSPR